MSIFRKRRKANLSQGHVKNNNHIYNPLQSAYKKHHSTESALPVLKVRNDIIISMDKGEVRHTALATIDHVILTCSIFSLEWNIWACSKLVFFLFEK